MRYIFSFILSFFTLTLLIAQSQPWQGKFEPIDNLLTPPSIYRTAGGAPTKAYWQQRADYKIKATLTITYHII